MGKITVSLNSTPTGVYRPGETISGTVNVNLEKPLAATKLVAMLHGEVNVKSASKTYLDCEEDLWNKTGTQSNAQATLAAGSHTFPFSFHLPAQLPSTIEGEKMFIRYRIKAKMYRKRGENYSDTKDFPVCSFLHMKPNLLESVSKEDQTMIGGRFNKTGPVILRVTLAKTAYEPGESIMIGPTVENNSKKSFAVLIANLCQHRVILGATVQKSSKAVAALVFDDGAVNAGETRTWSHEKMLFIPTDLPPTTHCELFKLDYSVDLILKGCDLGVSVPIVLGWKPPSASVSEPKSGAKSSSGGEYQPKDERKLSESKQSISKQDDGPEQQPKPRPQSREQQTRDAHEDAPLASRRVSQERQPQPQPRRTSQGQQDQPSNIYPLPPQAQHPPYQHPPPPAQHPQHHQFSPPYPPSQHPHAQNPPPPRAQRPPSFSEHPPYQHPPPPSAQHPPSFSEHPPSSYQHPPPPSAQHPQHPQFSPPYPPSQHPHPQNPPPPRAQRPPSFSEHPPYQHPPPPSAQHPQQPQFSPPYPPSQHPPSPHAPPSHAQHPPPPPRHAQYPPYSGRHSADFPNERFPYNPDYQQTSAPTAPPAPHADQDWDYRRH